MSAAENKNSSPDKSSNGLCQSLQQACHLAFVSVSLKNRSLSKSYSYFSGSYTPLLNNLISLHKQAVILNAATATLPEIFSLFKSLSNCLEQYTTFTKKETLGNPKIYQQYPGITFCKGPNWKNAEIQLKCAFGELNELMGRLLEEEILQRKKQRSSYQKCPAISPKK